MKSLITLCICVTILFAHFQTKAQITFNFTGGVVATGIPANITVGSLTQVNNNGSTTFVPTLGPAPVSFGYPGASAGKNGNCSAKPGAINTTSSTYIQLVLTPAVNNWVNISAISWGNFSLPGTGPGTLSIYSSIDNYTTAIAISTVTQSTTTWNLLNPTFAPINGIIGMAVTLRIYASGGTGTTPAASATNWRIDDLVIMATAKTGMAGQIPKYTSATTFANSIITEANNNIGIGITAPATKFDVAGIIKSTGLLMPTNASAGKVLTSDANGNATWQTPLVGEATDGSETKIVAGTPNVTITGNGTSPAPYTVEVSSPASYWTNSPIGTNNVINNNTGAVIIGTGITTLPPGYSLYVSDGILTEKVKVALKTGANWADHVFSKDYTLKPLSEVEAFIKTNKHLPGIQSAETLVHEGGFDITKMFAKQMEKIEELTLYLIDLNKKLEKIEKENTALKSMLSTTNQK